MRRQVLGRLLPLRRLRHVLPEGDRLSGVVAAARHVYEPDAVGFGFLLTAPWQRQAHLGAGTEQARDLPETLRIVRERAGCGGDRAIGELLPEDPLGAMLGDGVCDLVRDDGRELIVGLRNVEQAGEDDDLAAREAERVRFGSIDERELPVELRLVDRADAREALGDAPNLLVLGPGFHDLLALLGERLLEHLQSQLLLLFVAHRDALRATGDRDGLLLAREIRERHDRDRENQSEHDATSHDRVIPARSTETRLTEFVVIGKDADVTRHWNTPDRLQELLVELVSWNSVAQTDGEARFAGKLADRLRSVRWFAERPDAVALGRIDQGRAYVTATYRHPDAAETIVLLSHFDTVDTADYGAHELLACDPVRLTAAYAELVDELDPDAAVDAASGDYLFGRGTMDMKAGLALHMALIERAAAEQWPISLVLLAVPDEEVNSTGMRAAVEGLHDLASAHDLHYVLFLNGEPSFPAHPGDDRRYLYTGSIGKIMPSVLCYGRETHAGTPMSGLTSTYVASYVTQAMEFSDAFRETVHGETAPVPVTLDQHDRRDGYSTQTPFRTSALYNVFVMEQSAADVMKHFERVVRHAAERCLLDYRAICARDGVDPIGELRVLRFEELQAHAVDKLGQATVDELVATAVADGDDDLREQSLRIVEALLVACQELTPAIVLLFAPPFYPPVNSTDDELVAACVARVQQQASERFGTDVVQSHFFNGISDLSYVSFRGGPTGSHTYERNTPGFGTTYTIPFESMARLDAPVLNVGPFGKDPHKRTERLHVRSAFQELPELLADLVQFVASWESESSAQ